MAKSEKTPSFVIETPMKTSYREEKVLSHSLGVATKINNSTLSQMLKNINSMLSDERFDLARKMKKSPERTSLFKLLHQEHKVTKVDCINYATQASIGIKEIKRGSRYGHEIGSQVVQAIGQRIWLALERYLYHGGGRPRFKGVKRKVRSIEGNSNASGIRYLPDAGVINFNGEYIRLNIPNNSRYMDLALKNKVKFCRIVRKTIKGKAGYYAQLVLEGNPPKKYDYQKGEIGLDVGPSRIAVVGGDVVGLEDFAPSCNEPWQQIRLLQRKMDRSLRAMNPNNYNANGTAKKGCKTWIKSNRYIQMQNEYKEFQRLLTSKRKEEHGRLANKILCYGTTIKTEKLSYKAFQKLFGRSVKQRAPSTFIETLRRKAESAGGKMIDLDTWSLKMSQYNHLSGDYTKKPLSQRIDFIEDKVIDRDIYSAFLAYNVEGNKHNPTRLFESWETLGHKFQQAGLCKISTDERKSFRFPAVEIPSEFVACRKRLK